MRRTSLTELVKATFARLVKLVDTADLKSAAYGVWVRPPHRAPKGCMKPHFKPLPGGRWLCKYSIFAVVGTSVKDAWKTLQMRLTTE